MDAADSLLEVTSGRDSKNAQSSDKKYNVGNDCQMFYTMEVGGGDGVQKTAVYNIDETKPKFVTSTPLAEPKKEALPENVTDSNPECELEGKFGWMLDVLVMKLQENISLPAVQVFIDTFTLDIPNSPVDLEAMDTVTILNAPGGGKVYLVGTAHFSLQSQEDVSRVIQEVNPHIVMVELCEQRTNILLLDEEVILREAKNINIKKIRDTMAQNGVFNGLMYILLLNMSAHITRELGMAPGGEFRRAMAEAKKIPNCVVQLGDRAIDITLHRAIASLSWGQTIRFIWHLLTSNQSISAEEVEKCKQKKMLEDMLEEMADEFPALKRVFVVERDMYLCHSLQVAAMQPRREPCRIVGVVGIGHVAGIVEHWGKIKPQDIQPLLHVPPPSLSTRIIRISVRAAFVGAVIYAGYRLMPRRWLP